MKTVRQLPAVEKRVETGAVQFGDDWPGLFIRGDRAIYTAMHLKMLIRLIETTDLSTDHKMIALRPVKELIRWIDEGVDASRDTTEPGE